MQFFKILKYFTFEFFFFFTFNEDYAYNKLIIKVYHLNPIRSVGDCSVELDMVPGL